MKTIEFHSKGRDGFVRSAMPIVDKVSKSCISGLSKEVYNFSVAQVFLEITAVKVERSKKKLILLSKSQKNWKFKLWWLLYPEPHVLQRSNIPHPKALSSSFQNLYRQRAWPFQQIRHAPLNEKSMSFIQRGVTIFWGWPHPMLIEILKAGY